MPRLCFTMCESFPEVVVLDAAQNLYLIVLWVVLSIIWLLLLNRIWPPNRRRVHNDVIGWQISILGTIYAVMVGFMLYAVWANFQTAEANANAEANAAVDLYRTADGLPPAQRAEIQQAAMQYVKTVADAEWTTMNHRGIPHAAQPYIQTMWRLMTQSYVVSSTQEVSLNEAMTELNALTEHRRLRILESETAMPAILWTVLVIGGIITIASSCLIGSENAALHFSLIVASSLLISLALIAIADIDRPFQGSVHVSSRAFLRAQQAMREPMQ
jgi:hypothetical protein